MVDASLNSKVIQILRFPLIVGVIFIHSRLNNVFIDSKNILEIQDFPIYENLRFLLSEIIARISVPAFFFISGYLFFFKTTNFTNYVYWDKLKKRTKSLLIPYIFWNIIALICFLLVQTFTESMISSNNPKIIDYSFIDLLKDFWVGNNGSKMPINNPLWYIRDLMVSVILTPIIYKLIKTFNIYFLLVLFCLWFTGVSIPLPGFSFVSLFFFSLGAYLGILKKDFVLIKDNYFFIVFLFYLIIVCLIFFVDKEYILYFLNLQIILGLFIIISLSRFCVKKGCKIPKILTDSTFFLYVFHIIPLAIILKLLSIILSPKTDFAITIIYLLSPILTILLGVILFYFMSKFLPKFTSFVLGNR